MSIIEHLLGYVEKPSRYLGTEINCIKKDPASVKLSIALAFPDLYEIGTSHFGLQILYDILNKQEEIAAERVFAPARDMEKLLRDEGMPLWTLENKRALGEFDIIGFSLLYELNATNVLNMLDLAGLPLRSSQRNETHPLVIAGGPCVCSPEPMADFFDAMVFGDGESLILEMSRHWLQWKESGGTDRQALLEAWSHLDGVYVPSFFTVSYGSSGFQTLTPHYEERCGVRRAVVADLDNTIFPERPIVPYGRPVHDRLRLEVSRGCSRGCRFCQAGMIYRPVRERSPQGVVNLSRSALLSTGYEDLSLLSLSTGDYTCLASLMENLMVDGEKERIAVSLPSMRAGSLTPGLMSLIQKVRKTGFTIAPEAGSQRLRDVINKNVTFDDVAATVQDAFALGWQVIKLYFMIGLPTETLADLEAIVEMVRQLKIIKAPRGRRGQINVSITTFIPKPHTPFQWAPQISLEESKARIETIRNQLRVPGIQVKWQNPAMSMLEGVLARGDRRLGAVIESAWKKGALFDGWNDQFDFSIWQAAFEECSLDMDFFTIRPRSLDEPLPWDHMQSGVQPKFLKAQWEAAHREERVADCRWGNCHQCGVCDFKEVRPRIFREAPMVTGQAAERDVSKHDRSGYKLELTYTKLGQARYFGHLEQANIIARALRRAHIDVLYSGGYHPMPRISFDNPLPLGIESEGEKMRLTVNGAVSCDHLLCQLNRQLPEGLKIIDCRPFSKTTSSHQNLQRYRVFLSDCDVIEKESIRRFMQNNNLPFERHKTKGRVQTVDLKTSVQMLNAVDAHTLEMELDCRHGSMVRPADILKGIFGFDADMLRRTRIRKLIESNN